MSNSIITFTYTDDYNESKTVTINVPKLNTTKKYGDQPVDSKVFRKYLDILLETNKNFCNIYSFTNNRLDGILVNPMTCKYSLTENMYNSLKKCMKDNTVNYILIPIIIFSGDKNSELNHQNIVIVNKKEGIFEFFEPHGISFHSIQVYDRYGGVNYISLLYKDTEDDIRKKLIDAEVGNIENILLKINKIRQNATNTCKLVNQAMYDLFKKHYNINNIEFKNVNNVCPRVSGVQHQDVYCVGWSLLYFHLRIINLSMSYDVIIQYLKSIPYNTLLDYMKSYIMQITNEVEMNKTIINVDDVFNESKNNIDNYKVYIRNIEELRKQLRYIMINQKSNDRNIINNQSIMIEKIIMVYKNIIKEYEDKMDKHYNDITAYNNENNLLEFSYKYVNVL